MGCLACGDRCGASTSPPRVGATQAAGKLGWHSHHNTGTRSVKQAALTRHLVALLREARALAHHHQAAHVGAARDGCGRQGEGGQDSR